MKEQEKAKQLWHLFYFMGKMRMQSQAQDEARMRDVMTLGMIAAEIERSEKGMIKMSDVSAYFRITPAAVSQLVRIYERKGWLVRTVLESDRRSVYLYLSEEGMRLLKEQEQGAMQGIVDFIHYLGEEDSDALIRILQKAKDYGPIVKHRK